MSSTNISKDDFIPHGISDEKLYEIAMNAKFVTEERRDDINKFYISLFSGIISIMPFIPKVIDKANLPFNFTISIFLLFIAVIGTALSISWILMLKRINYYLKGIENYVTALEKKNKQGFMIEMTKYLEQKHSPGRVTKQQMIIPSIFTIIFITMFVLIIGYNIMPL